MWHHDQLSSSGKPRCYFPCTRNTTQSPSFLPCSFGENDIWVIAIVGLPLPRPIVLIKKLDQWHQRSEAFCSTCTACKSSSACWISGDFPVISINIRLYLDERLVVWAPEERPKVCFSLPKWLLGIISISRWAPSLMLKPVCDEGQWAACRNLLMRLGFSSLMITFFCHPNASVPVFSVSEQPRCLVFFPPL